jgi:hypothetical protein
VQSRRQYILFFLLVAGVVTAAFVLGKPRKLSVLDAVPRDAWLVVTLDAPSLRASPLAKPLMGAGDKSAIPGLGSLTAHCGFDPVAKLGEVAVTSPENGERGEFGVAFTGDFTKDELVACASSTIKARSGTPAVSSRGSFTVIADAGDASHARVAYREGGPFLVGRGSWLDAMIDAADGKAERMRPEHITLRQALTANDANGNASPSAPRARAILATALLPASLRDKLKAEMGSEAEGEGKANATFAAVLGVSQAGVAVSTGGEGSVTEIAAELGCESQAACEEVKRFLERKRLSLSKDIGVRLIGLGPLLDSVTVEVQGPHLRASARASSDDLARGVDRAMQFAARRSAPALAPAPAPGSAPIPAPSH